MRGSKAVVLCAAVSSVLCLSAAPRASAQGLHNILSAKDRVFPAVGAGVEALKRDSIGHYYILADPATSILIYDTAGKLLGRIPNANSRGATIHYAVSMDFDVQDRLFVADRGDNAVKIFASNGALIASVPVTAPTSVVALPDGQFAVTQLESKRLVKVMDQKGKTVRTFGDPADQPGGAPAVQSENQPSGKPPVPVVMDRGRITGDSKGNIYFAFTSLPDPTLQRFDRFGYSAFESVMPATDFGALGGRDGRDIEIGYTMSGVTGPDSITAWTDLHSVRASVGRGMGGGRGRGGAAAAAAASTNTSAAGAAATQSAAATPSLAPDDSSDSSDNDLPEISGDILNYNSQSSGNTDTTLSYTAASTAGGYGFMTPGMFGMGFGGGFHPRSPGLFGGGGFGGGGESHPDMAGRPGGGEEFDRFGHFHPGFSTYRATATVKVALDDPSKHKLEKPMLTAVGVDPQSEEVWATIGDTLVRLDNNGNRLDVFYLAAPNGAAIRPTSVLVEPDRILIASDQWGIFEFPRPDRPSATPGKKTLVPQQISPATPAPAATH